MQEKIQESCLPFLRALGDGSRWQITKLLVGVTKPVTLGDIAQRLKLSTYNASRHIRILYEAGILSVERDGRFKMIAIADGFRGRIRSQTSSDILDLGCCKFDFSHSETSPPLPENATLDTARDTMLSESPARYIMIGGFLGAGKTTAVSAVARHLSENAGKRVGLITNDQGRELVDTRMLRSQGFATEEIAGGCFCCKFNSLIDAAGRLTEDAIPEIFIAEPVGSCTDLVATVTYPLRRIYGERFTIAPLSVLVDPMRARRILKLDQDGRSFSDKVVYIYRKQLEEADVIVVSKSDLLDEAGEMELCNALSTEFPNARILAISAKTGTGMEPWLKILESEEQIARPLMEIDYDTYADGEALLGWLNATVNLEVEDEYDSSLLLEKIAKDIQKKLSTQDIEVAHLKMTLSPENAFAGEVAVINLVRSDFRPEFGQELDEPVTGGQIIVNLRAEGDPELLESIFRETLGSVSSPACTLSLEHLERFRPGRPNPTHRDFSV